MNTLTPQVQLKGLAKTILKEHEQAISSAIDMVEHMSNCGKALLEAKASMKHGEWLPWLRTNVPKIAIRTAQKYMSEASKCASRAYLSGPGVVNQVLLEADLIQEKPRQLKEPEPAPAIQTEAAAYCRSVGIEACAPKPAEPRTDREFCEKLAGEVNEQAATNQLFNPVFQSQQVQQPGEIQPARPLAGVFCPVQSEPAQDEPEPQQVPAARPASQDATPAKPDLTGRIVVVNNTDQIRKFLETQEGKQLLQELRDRMTSLDLEETGPVDAPLARLVEQVMARIAELERDGADRLIARSITQFRQYCSCRGLV